MYDDQKDTEVVYIFDQANDMDISNVFEMLNNQPDEAAVCLLGFYRPRIRTHL